MFSKRRTVVIFAKAPLRGTVKTRLAADIGSARANWVYRRLTAHVLRQAISLPDTDVVLAVTPERFATRSRFWPNRIKCIPQGSGGLGPRMARALDRFAAVPVLLVGSDIPGLNRAGLEQAFRLLRQNDYVFGPASDGGFWLVGVKGREKTMGLFDRVRWSSRYALEDTIANVRKHRRFAYAETLNDLDTFEDLNKVDGLNIDANR